MGSVLALMTYYYCEGLMGSDWFETDLGREGGRVGKMGILDYDLLGEDTPTEDGEGGSGGGGGGIGTEALLLPDLIGGGKGGSEVCLVLRFSIGGGGGILGMLLL